MKSSNWAIAQLPGLSSQDSAQLEAKKIYTTLQLIQQGSTQAKRNQLATQLQIHTKHVNKWVALADLSRIPAVGCRYCGLLLHAGVSSSAQLAQTPIHKLYPQVRRFYAAVLRQMQDCPAANEVSQWIQEARSLSGHS
ncbi:MAG: DUF4332 domain-containing protein [Leptolyngbyaceae cyanobacterium SM1_1_3]|nr:DUF4332 domain-containing protein [Leptolyngbyaceae cyanobacterium SM1_1_3]NJN02396.1 DUF4332 domain-containing protein [Leptolyngbyaceae cyanobacterium RM1_1_2]NJO10370.1 DUF4332 domain-containing protein [Leptolyngbyaceae cyanobacterium SL_1_1]